MRAKGTSLLPSIKATAHFLFLFASILKIKQPLNHHKRVIQASKNKDMPYFEQSSKDIGKHSTSIFKDYGYVLGSLGGESGVAINKEHIINRLNKRISEFIVVVLFSSGKINFGSRFLHFFTQGIATFLFPQAKILKKFLFNCKYPIYDTY